MRAIQNNSKNASNIDDGLRSLGWVCLARLLIQQMTGNMLADWWAIWQSRRVRCQLSGWWMKIERGHKAGREGESESVWEGERGSSQCESVEGQGEQVTQRERDREAQRPNLWHQVTPDVFPTNYYIWCATMWRRQCSFYIHQHLHPLYSCCEESRSKSRGIVIIRTCQNPQDPSFRLLLKPGCG